MDADRLNFIGRLGVPTAMMAAGLWYCGSLWGARLRDQNLIMILPVVVFMIPCYVAIVLFELRRFRALQGTMAPSPPRTRKLSPQIIFIGVSIAGTALFPLTGAVAATLFVLVVGMLVLGERKWVTIVSTSVVTTVVLWLIFVKGFGIRMPLFPWG